MSNLEKLIILEKEARGFGFDWPNAEMIIRQAESECKEVRAAINDKESRERVQEEIGDLLHTAISLCVFRGLDVEETITKTTYKFKARMEALKQTAEEQGLSSLEGQSMEFMLTLWEEAKRRTYNEGA
jgi:uncharacterized protein YabN with tetrapyrrole methylase and pyrophosphatase domain